MKSIEERLGENFYGYRRDPEAKSWQKRVDERRKRPDRMLSIEERLEQQPVGYRRGA